MTLPITTQRLRLRRFALSDAADLLECVSHSSFARATPEIRPTADGVHAYIKMQNRLTPFQYGKCFDLAIERRADQKLIGLLTLVVKDHLAAEVGYALGIDHRGQGYATEAAAALIGYAFSQLDLHRVQATTATVNEPSWRVMDRLGMKREACLRQAEYRDGEWLDTLLYAVLATEWPPANGAD